MTRKHHILLLLLASVLVTTGCGDSGVHQLKKPPVENTDENEEDVGNNAANNNNNGDNDAGNESDANINNNGDNDAGNESDESDANNNPIDESDADPNASACTTQCSGNTPICNETNGSCVECLDASHCTGTGLATCNANNTCSYTEPSCLAGFVDLDGDPSNGCECKITNPNDIPDIEGKDTNCDGVDGILGVNVLFVSAANGNNANDGKSPNAPKKSIQNAIQAAVTANIPHVLVAAGTYNETITLADGVSVHGGYNPTTWKRDIQTNDSIIKNTAPEYESALNGYRTVIAQNITAPTTLSAVTIIGPDATPDKNGASSFGLWSLNSQNLTVEHSVVRAGKASNGRQALNKALLCIAHAGGDGGAADTVSRCSNSFASGMNGIQGESNDPGKPNNGGFFGFGGTSQCGTSVHDNGSPGSDGKKGADGIAGENAIPLTASNMGSLANNGHWTNPIAQNARTGQKGAGGGGGGGGGSSTRSNINNSTLAGGNGGKGGDGGCGGTPGFSGVSGGSSIAIAISGGKVTMAENHIVLGKAGNGGDGTTGSEGKAGANGVDGELGQVGELDTFLNTNRKGGKGGNGGNGGKGGKGGTGAGGHGGNAIGLATSNNANIIGKDTLTYDATPAAVGQPGTSPTPAFKGLPGKIETSITYTN